MVDGLPADLAEIQARHDDFRIVAESSDPDVAGGDAWVDAAAASLGDVPALVAEVTEWRARPTLTAEEARNVISWAEAVDEEEHDGVRMKDLPWGTHEITALAKLRAIAEGAGS